MVLLMLSINVILKEMFISSIIRRDNKKVSRDPKNLHDNDFKICLFCEFFNNLFFLSILDKPHYTDLKFYCLLSYISAVYNP